MQEYELVFEQCKFRKDSLLRNRLVASLPPPTYLTASGPKLNCASWGKRAHAGFASCGWAGRRTGRGLPMVSGRFSRVTAGAVVCVRRSRHTDHAAISGQSLEHASAAATPCNA